MKSRPR